MLKAQLKYYGEALLLLLLWFMTAFSGIDGIKMMSNLGGLPALFVVIAMNAALLVWLWKSIVERFAPSKDTEQGDCANYSKNMN